MKQKFINIQKTYESTKSSKLCLQKKKFKQRICILEGGASGEKVGDIENIIVKNLFEIQFYYIKLINL